MTIQEILNKADTEKITIEQAIIVIAIEKHLRLSLKQRQELVHKTVCNL